jgi:hypothetical protein
MIKYHRAFVKVPVTKPVFSDCTYERKNKEKD